jgi:exodeoxyribonuclease-3
MSKTLKIISWNVNGIRAVLKKNFLAFIDSEQPDILCLQETKAEPEQVELHLPGYPFRFWNSAQKKGYSGTAIFCKKEPLSVSYGIGIEKHDLEGRVITADFGAWYLVDVYVPNSQRGIERLDYRHKEWDVDFLAYLKKIEEKKPVIFCGDLNVAHKEIDLARPKNNHHNAGFTDEERAGFDNIIAAGFLDTFREFESGGGHYSWWSYMGHSREKNIGWRVDYFCISASLRNKLKKAYILPAVTDSDHAPVAVEMTP